MYQRINGSDWRNIWLMGDLHGCFALLMNRLRQLRFDPWANLLISVGDLIDRGPQSADCLGLLRCRWFRAVRGIMSRWRWRRWRAEICGSGR